MTEEEWLATANQGRETSVEQQMRQLGTDDEFEAVRLWREREEYWNRDGLCKTLIGFNLF